ncbi:hypothetical protein CEF21_08160 [Bacillus sp. FJAT-42376]|uniref:hypothetical protein n=1 Tax=Bacillus sp. FJAT-42376 TaxID=2014076 RepID=UPI000F4EE132|nr:hypothetical protein [Bacillus sp. FJAT-42376]AZB42262.1 hypothetical protein CEF21_08160 [Bacillus sp. FJAT-42376]
MKKWWVGALLITVLAACGLKTETFTEIYGKSMKDVTEIVITRGDGRTKTLNSSQAREFLNGIKTISFVPDKNQEKGAGYAYAFDLYEGEEKTLSFTTNRINDYNYHSDPDLVKFVDGVWNK